MFSLENVQLMTEIKPLKRKFRGYSQKTSVENSPPRMKSSKCFESHYAAYVDLDLNEGRKGFLFSEK